ncbi:unnamed protein product [Microthlaspi erraticum]|uniref:DUF6821 domain-containing protein n=1 Tax=Microthlaspi erraticum TaxID=1685480 RepID=A0A6D2J2F9_9BRAS|nr:unnamed protein product [Microthlaspi erraticum]
MDGELLDWELVHGSDTESTDSVSSEKISGSSSVIDDGMILSDHFSADNLVNIPDQSLESGDSSRVGYGSDPVDLGFDQSGDACVGNELAFHDSKTGNSGDGDVKLSDFDEKHDESEAISEFESQSDIEEPVEDSSKSWSDSGGNEMVSGDSVAVNGEEEIVSDAGVVSTEAVEESGVETVEAVVAVNSGDESKSRGEPVWWKMPFVLVKYCAFRVGPVWSVSMAAALMGFVLLGRRLYNMKKKAQSFHLKVTIDDKKVSRVMSQAARLNEVFTEVRRVPVIRPALPSPGAWPVLSLR